MLTKKAILTVGAASALALSFASPLFAEDIPEMEKENIQGTGPDVDPGASRGTDPSIVDQEKANIGGSGPDVDPGASQGPDPSIVDQEKKDLE